MDVHVCLGHVRDAHPGAAALAAIGLLCPGAGALGQHQVFHWITMIFPTSIFLVSAHILILNYRQQDENNIKDGLTLDD